MRSKLVLVLALVMGIVTTFLFFQYMNQVKAEKAMNSNLVKIVVANEKILKNEQISAQKLGTMMVPEKALHANAIKNQEDAVGKLANADIEQGETVMSHRLGSQVTEHIYVSRKVQDGYRAVSVGANFNQSVSTLIEPEDEVDVIFSKKVEGPEVKIESRIILQKARVLAVGRKMVLPEDTQEPYAEYSSVTVELTPEDAVKLVNSAEQGNIHFMLHKRPVITEKEAAGDSDQD
ncbi:Flp pilus assembly protein CpaB [Mesobacillus selenatarsenatis]|uniref:Flp pilus assembly protein RcpC/CpaB n=1 Tax=Mesobacillus selenatarsenatis (strain DSM 18680 / JCM 14380 / FERM P-15431 / SF-1) TaxID=1321606 RepID=A0A0A8X6M6_MESS1|nr:Flp pilus assembly protein CpaB [Mesobacillus selenatarsenatis]GAM15630.1 Flp pilus assembly protein RcpC/CpaB [Mesobacillus selenatarsenatis SF-1]